MDADRLSRLIRLKERIQRARRAEMIRAERSESLAQEHVQRAEAEVRSVADNYLQPGELSGREFEARARLVDCARGNERSRREALVRAQETRREKAARVQETDREISGLTLLKDRFNESERRRAEHREQREQDAYAARIARAAG